MSQPRPIVPPQYPPGAVTAEPREARPGRGTHGWFAVIWVIYLIDYADRFAISAVLPSIQAEFALSDAQLGLMSGSLFLGLALLAVPCGIAVDRFSRRYMIVMMTLVWSLATWSTGMARSYAELVAARVLVGAGEAGYNPAGYALIAAWYPRSRHGTMIGLFNMAQPLGIGLGIMLGGTWLPPMAGAWFSVCWRCPVFCLWYLAIPLLLHSVAIFGSMHSLSWPVFVVCYGAGQFFGAANWGTLVAAGIDLSPPHYRATVQSFLPLFQAIAALGAGIVSGLLSDRFGLAHTLGAFLVIGMVSGLLLLDAT